MLLSFPDILSLFVSPTQVQGALIAGRKARVKDVFQRSTQATAADQWQSLGQTCAELVTLSGARRLNLVLSDQFARYACFPWRAELRSDQEDLAMVRLAFDDVHGANASADWHIRFNDAPPGQDRLSVALPVSLVAKIRNRFDAMLPSGVSVRSVTTSFAATLQTYRKTLSAKAWLLHLEANQLTLGAWDGSGWKQVVSGFAALQDGAELVQRLQQELAMANCQPEQGQPIVVYVHTPALLEQTLPAVPGLDLRSLRCEYPDANPAYAFALLGAGS